MKPSFIAAFLAFVVVATPLGAQAASASSTGGSRYFIQSTKSFWKSAFSARHTFADGFTADLSDLQVRIARFAGLRPISVKTFNILTDATSPSPTASASPQPTPAESIGWGQEVVLGSAAGSDGGLGVNIAVLDTGVDRTHPDLQGRIAACADYTDTSKPMVADSCTDVNGHGTHMAGLIAATGGPDGIGMIGMAPLASVSAFKVCDDEGNCNSDDVAVAMRDAVDAGANIIVLGLGGEQESSLVSDALQYAVDHNVMVIAAAGNDGPYDDSLDWPASDSRTISVGALASDLTVADFSSRGNNAKTKAYHQDNGDLEFVAPGVNVESTFTGGTYAILSGTSMSSAVVAGLAARVWQADDEHPASATRTVLHSLAKDIAPAGDDNASGWGVPELLKAPEKSAK